MKLTDVLDGVKTIAISGHIRPDGDCVGSTLGLYNYLNNVYPQYQVSIYLDEIPKEFLFMNRSNEILHDRPDHVSYDLFIAIDCGDLGRLGDSAKLFTGAKKTFCIDHHISNQSFADTNYIFPKASSASELVYELLEEEKISKDVAECLYTGMVHDSGVFQYNSTSKKTMTIAGSLMEMGINFTEIVDKTFYEKTLVQNQIMGQVLIGARLYSEGRVIVGIATHQDMDRFGAQSSDLDGIVNQLRITKGVEVAVFLHENEDGIKVSMRSNGPDVASVAVKFGGGGHIRAAGVTMEGSVNDALDRLLKEIEKVL